MKIGIDASRAFLRHRTGIEEYGYQVIKHLRAELDGAEVILYVRKKIVWQAGRLRYALPEIGFALPSSWRVKGIWAPRFWTQWGLSLEMLFFAPDVLFVPAHTVPFIHPQRTIVTVHGLEYEFSPESYGFWERLYMRWSIQFSVKVSERVIAVSENTKRDLIRLYSVAEGKILVVYEGIGVYHVSGITYPVSNTRYEIQNTRYFLFIGRLETRKNVVRIIEAFECFKEKTSLPHQLILIGKPGHGYSEIKKQIAKSKYQNVIQEVGYVSETEKWRWLRGAEIFLFPSLYEGFGLPVIEAQSVGVPVITSDTSSLPEIAGEGAVFVDPTSVLALALAMEEIVRNPEKRADIIEKATRNVDRFSWATCAREVGGIFVGRGSV